MNTGSRTGFFGGSFDPPHLAHSVAALWALESGEVDRVLVVPTALHPFGKEFAAPFEDRLAMCRLAFARLGEGVEVCDIEGSLDGPSYTCRTIKALLADRPGSRFRLLAGSDIIRELPKWKDAAELLELAPVLELPRLEGSPDVGPADGIHLPAISSSLVREVLARGESTRNLLGSGVRAYVDGQGLYQRERET